MNKERWIIPLAAVLFTLIIYGTPMGMGNKPQLPEIRIDGQVAILSLMMPGVSSVFMRINNTGNSDDNLIGGHISVAGTVVELHDVKNGKMVKIEKIRIPAQGTVELKPKGIHIMILNLPATIKENSEIILYLQFKKSGEIKVPLRVLMPSGASEPHRDIR